MVRKRFTVWTLALVVAVTVVTACATLTVTKSAETLSAIGEAFVSSHRQITEAYQAGLVTEPEYAKWRAFIPQFQRGYREADAALRMVRASGETTTPRQVTDLILALKNQLLRVVLELYAPAAKGVQ